MNGRKWVLLAVLALALLGVVLYALLDEAASQPVPAPSPEALLDAVMDRAGITRWAEALDWYDMEAAGLLPEGHAGPDTPVWAGREGTHFHSVPVCPGLKAPVRMTLAEALDQGLRPCAACWVAE